MADKSLMMSFMNEQGKKVSIRVDGVKDGVTQAEISAAMDAIIAKNIFETAGGDLKIKDSAQIVEKTVEKIAVK
ncbi:DUF2922 domain-containing protein [Clostridium omnivorum]|uniref:DUF2922 domain-containing protein n=1 Tax=Clostridium omnivorum TaxID=1604902 RepID=A0ABQ5N6G7_9CLOT|nr:DUF2922 domain-containing protein [Clostridium sp. E14]GLC30806.1 hypothetical protein bsdE14_22160 [Clostridium sp. E14]